MSKIQFFSIEEALIGTYYRSSVRKYNDGIIVHAERKEYSDDFIVRVRPEGERGYLNEFWATISCS